MPLQIEPGRETGSGSSTVIHLTGSLVIGPDLYKARDQIYRWIEKCGTRTLVLEMSGVQRVDSAGIGEIVVWYGRAAKSGMPLVLMRPTPLLQRLLEVTGLDAILDVVTTVS